ncbi:MAG: sialidase family protein [Bacteroides sp.]
MKNYPCFYLTCSFLLLCLSALGQVQVNQFQPLLPVLTLKEANPVLRLELIKSGEDARLIKDIVCSLKGTTRLDDIESVCLYAAAKNGSFSAKTLLTAPQPATSKVTFKYPLSLQADTTIVWLSVKLKDKIDLAHRIQLSCTAVKTDLGKVTPITVRPLVALRTGVAVRQYQQDGVHTSRIPGIATSQKGTLLAVYDARYDTSRDLQGDIDIALNRSFDGGATWQPMQVVLDRKEWGGLPEKYNGVSDACVLVDRQTGAIYVAGLWMHGVLDGKTGRWVEGITKDSTRWIHQWHAKGSQPGLGVKETSQFLITKSLDDGQTWSEPINITAQTKHPEWWLFAPAPGHGITLKDGTLVFPTQGRDKEGLPFSNITYSKDGGNTWATSRPAYHNTTECMAVELSNGDIMLNMRDNRNHGNKEVNGRRICVTSDLGETWTEHPTSRKALVEPTCMASLHRHTYRHKGVEKSILLFCNPESYNSRDHMTLKVSFDDGRTWSADRKILLDEYGSFGYSCITSVDESTIGVFYESSQAQMAFQQVKLEELIGK